MRGIKKRSPAKSLLCDRLLYSSFTPLREIKKRSPAKSPLCDRSLLPLCPLRLCGSLKKRSPN
ncbi:MAG: hypothetical protein KME55_17565 [Nostoc indistinguendum CM1-VF10]|nr:hypothetical protein [Nostoc indistinguendum CM1-VF10]